MAWTTPRTWVTNELVTASIMNTHVRDNLNALFSPLSDGWTGAVSDNPASTSFADVDATNLSLSITPVGDTILIGYVGFVTFSAGTSGTIALDVDINGTRVSGDAAGLTQASADNAPDNASFTWRETGLTPGVALTAKLQFRELATNDVTLESRGFWVAEVT